jgi:hypothetical protein
MNQTDTQRWRLVWNPACLLIALFVMCDLTMAQDARTVDDSRAAEIDDLEPAASTSARTSTKPSAMVPARPAAAQTGPITDRRRLDTMSIIGNQELPKVLYIVPWKRSELGDLMGRPVNSLLDEVLAPVDRDVFRRYLEYYEELHPDQSRDSE